MIRTLLADSGLLSKFWVDTILIAAFLINRLPSAKLNNASPYQVLYNTKPDYTHLKIFGCLCFLWLRPYIKHKLQSRSVPCVFIGYGSSFKGYRCLDPKIGRVYTTHHVIFDENQFFFLQSSNQHHYPSSQSSSSTSSITMVLIFLSTISNNYNLHPHKAIQPP